jgi:hypothetical protein
MSNWHNPESGPVQKTQILNIENKAVQGVEAFIAQYQTPADWQSEVSEFMHDMDPGIYEVMMELRKLWDLRTESEIAAYSQGFAYTYQLLKYNAELKKEEIPFINSSDIVSLAVLLKKDYAGEPAIYADDYLTHLSTDSRNIVLTQGWEDYMTANPKIIFNGLTRLCFQVGGLNVVDLINRNSLEMPEPSLISDGRVEPEIAQFVLKNQVEF